MVVVVVVVVLVVVVGRKGEKKRVWQKKKGAGEKKGGDVCHPGHVASRMIDHTSYINLHVKVPTVEKLNVFVVKSKKTSCLVLLILDFF